MLRFCRLTQKASGTARGFQLPLAFFADFIFLSSLIKTQKSAQAESNNNHSDKHNAPNKTAMLNDYIDCSTMTLVPMGSSFNSPPSPFMVSAASSSAGSISSSGSSVSDSSSNTAPLSKNKKKCKKPDKTKTPLPLDFEPNPEVTVLCGRSRDCYEWEGNRRFRIICNSFLQDYLDASGKLEKSKIVTAAMKKIRNGHKMGVFVTYENGRYYEVSQRTSREKVGGFFRDSLPEEYRSSAKAKLARKKADTATCTVPTNMESTLFQYNAQDVTPIDVNMNTNKQPDDVDFPGLSEIHFDTSDDGKCSFLGATSFFDVECV